MSEAKEEPEEREAKREEPEERETSQTPTLSLDYSSPNPLEEDLLHINLITHSQYNLIKRFQKAFLKHRELNSTALYEPKANASGGKFKDQIIEIAEESMDYWKYLNLIDSNSEGNKNSKTLEYYFCSNLSLRRLKELNTTKETKTETVKKTKKSGKIRVREIEVIKEYFDEDKLADYLMETLKILDSIEAKVKREEERRRKIWEKKRETERENWEYQSFLNKLNEIIRKDGKRRAMQKLGLNNNLKLLDRILNGDENYPFRLYKKIKNLCEASLKI